MHRHEYYEDPLESLLQERKLGQVVGGGTEMAPNGEVAGSDIEIELNLADEASIGALIDILNELGAARGSVLTVMDDADKPRRIEFGVHTGMAIYLNGTDLPDEVYANNDVNALIEQLRQVLTGSGFMESYWEGPTETALYFRGASFDDMRSAVAPVIDAHPLAQQARVEQIAGRSE